MCSNDVDGGGAVVGTTVYLPCLSGIVAVSTRILAAVATSRLELGCGRWSSGGRRRLGLEHRAGRHPVRYRPHHRAVERRASIGVPANHFPTPSVGDQLLLAPAADQVVAFAAPAPGATGGVTTTTTTPVSSPPPVKATDTTGGGLSAAS